MPGAIALAKRMFPGNDLTAGEYPADVIRTIERLQTAGIRDWGVLLGQVATRDACVNFVVEHDLIFEEIIDLLNYLLRWAFPFQTASRELLDHENPQEMACYDSLKRHHIMTSFDLLEGGHAHVGRSALAELTGLPLGFITALVHRADIARLPYVRRKTILPLCGAGYDTLAKIAAADMTQMETELDTYFWRIQGKSWENYKSVILPGLLITCAKALPVLLVE